MRLIRTLMALVLVLCLGGCGLIFDDDDAPWPAPYKQGISVGSLVTVKMDGRAGTVRSASCSRAPEDPPPPSGTCQYEVLVATGNNEKPYEIHYFYEYEIQMSSHV